MQIIYVGALYFKHYHFNAKSLKKSKKRVQDLYFLFVDPSDRRKKANHDSP